MDIDLLRTFLEVRRLGNFRSAAENLHVTQAAVSQRIKHLESLLDAALFVREKNNITPTAAGEQLAEAAESIVATWQRARRDIGLTVHDGPRLTLAARPGLWSLCAERYLAAVAAGWPLATLQAATLSEDVAVRRVIGQTLDIAFVLNDNDADTVNRKLVGTFELALFARRRRTLAQAVTQPYVQVDWGRDLGPLFGMNLGFAGPVRLHTSDHVIAAEYLATNDGCALLPLASAERGARLKRVEGSPQFTRQVYAIWNRRNPQGAWIREIIDALGTPAVAPAADSVEV